MVLRDVRDMGKQQRKRQRRYEDYYVYEGCEVANRKLHRKYSKKMRVRRKKNMSRVIVFESKQKHIKKEKIKKEKDVCSICCDSTENIKYINCKRGGTQNVNFGKYNECCKDKPICDGCRIKCATCPFCKNHCLVSFKKTFPKKKVTYAVRNLQRRLIKEEYIKTYNSMQRFCIRHEKAWKRWRKQGGFYYLVAEQMGLKWKISPFKITSAISEFNWFVKKIPLSTFNLVSKRTKKIILEIEEQMRREREEQMRQEREERERREREERERIARERRRERERWRYNVMLGIAYSSMSSNITFSPESVAAIELRGKWKTNPKRFISDEGPHPNAIRWETVQQAAGDAGYLTISYFD